MTALNASVTTTELAALLRRTGLSDLAPLFAAHDIEDAVLPDLGEDDLREIGLTLGQRKKVMRELDRLRAAYAPRAGPRDGAEEELEVRRLTIMFCDLVGSTELSRRLKPDELYDVLQDYYRLVAKVTRRFDGYISTLQGDGIAVLFGYPRTSGANAEKAIGAGIALQEIVAAHEHRLSDGSALRIRTRVGIATGSTVVGEAARAS